ncbi:MAG: ATP-binding protein [Vicingaceae bacterium]|nr:ATP-binding protein [Vicingaceae bacterium]
MILNKFVLTGPESTGKTTLTTLLANRFEAPLVEEQARTYLNNLTKPYELHDVLKMAENQLKFEQEAISQNPSLLFIDTDLITFKIWLKIKYDKEIEWINNAISNQPNKHYFLCNIDLPWEADPLREHPRIEDRKFIFEQHLQILNQLGFSFTIISGDVETRLKKCISFLENSI